MKKTILTLAGALAVLAFVSCEKTGPKYGGKTPDSIRVLYWNLQDGMWGDEPNNYDNFVEYVKRVNPDICIWCEAATMYKTGTDEYLTTEKNGYHVGYLPDHWPSVASRYGHNYTFRGYRRNDFPQQVTAKYPIVKKWQSVDSEIQRDSTICDGATLFEVDLYNGTKLYVNTCHLWRWDWSYAADGNVMQQNLSALEHGGDKQRRAELQYMMEWATKDFPDYRDKFWILAGDMNSISSLDYPDEDAEQPKFYAHQYMNTRSGLVDAVKKMHPTEKLNSHVNGNRIDYIYVSPFAADRIKSCYIDTTDPFVSDLRSSGVNTFRIPSDHRPIVMDIKIK